MNFIQPTAQYCPQNKSTYQHIARIGRICYKAPGKQPDPDLNDEEREAFIEQRDSDRCRSFWESGHRSMFRHGSLYFFIPNLDEFPTWTWYYLSENPYYQTAKKLRAGWVSTNLQAILERPKISQYLEYFQVSEQDFIAHAVRYECYKAFSLVRMTFVLTTQISTSRELNRTSPNCIAEQSTRYVNLQKRGGVQIATPHWYSRTRSTWRKFLFRTSCSLSECFYRLLLRSGLRPEDARGVLPLDTYTVVAYTYTIREWKHILDLRYHGTTGTPHPNAHLVSAQIHQQILDFIHPHFPKVTI